MQSKKLEEGTAKIEQAQKHLKTSFLKWKPDYTLAAQEYSEAATCFKTAGTPEKSKECYIKAAECHLQNGALFHAAKCFDQAILVAKDLPIDAEIATLAEKASNYYHMYGSAEAAATSLDKAAKIIEKNDPLGALKLYKKAVDIVLIEESNRQAAEYISKIARIYVRLKMFDEAAKCIREEMSVRQEAGTHVPEIGRLTVALVLVEIARGDIIAAEKAFKEWGSTCDAPEAENLQRLLLAYDEEDESGVQKALSHPFIMHMDVEYSRLARELKLPQDSHTKSSTTTNANTLASSSSVQKPNQEEEEDEGGLC